MSWAIFQIFPLFWLIYSSFKPASDIMKNMFALPRSFYLGNYDFHLLAQRGITIGIYLKNSFVITITSLLILAIISLLAGYAIAKIRFVGKNILIIFLICLLGIPVHSLIVPLYFFIAKIGLLNSYFGLILPYVAFFAPFSVLMMQTYFREFPDEIIEAAKIDGCSNIRAFFSVVLPMSLGAISTTLILNYIYIYNEFLFSLIIMKNNAAKTINVGLLNFKGQYNTDWGPMFAAIAISILPSLIFYFIFHRNIVKGILTGALKE
jgi:ABC-type glycerol-3-phosphate transport system permease component